MAPIDCLAGTLRRATQYWTAVRYIPNANNQVILRIGSADCLLVKLEDSPREFA